MSARAQVTMGASLDGSAQVTLEGMNYLKFLRELARRQKPQTYFEIGTRFGDSLAQVDCRAICVDPTFELRADYVGQKPELHLYQCDSDTFFRRPGLALLFSGGIDLAFLDGMHRIEYLVRDFINTERFCRPDSIVLIHDCLPGNAEMTEREHRPQLRRNRLLAPAWTGDVWKILYILREHRPDLSCTVLDCWSSGLLLVTGFGSGNPVLLDRYHDIMREWMGRTLDDAGLRRLYRDFAVVSAAAYLDQHWPPT